MKGGNITAYLQLKEIVENAIGEQTERWSDLAPLPGYLDLITPDRDGRRQSQQLYTPITESTHVFLCSTKEINLDGLLPKEWLWDEFDFRRSVITDATGIKGRVVVEPETARLVINADVYDIVEIDDPLQLHAHLEIYLRRHTRGKLGGLHE